MDAKQTTATNISDVSVNGDAEMLHRDAQGNPVRRSKSEDKHVGRRREDQQRRQV
jgi:hypothetical protein